jgi:hypothetical protein
MLKQNRSNLLHGIGSWLVVLAVAVFAGQAALAATYDLERGKVTLDVPSKWEDAKNLFGVPLMLLGPMEGETRPTISVTAVGKNTMKFDPAELKKTEADYLAGRKRWLEDRDGEFVAFSGYRNEKFSNGADAHVIGYRYTLNGEEFAESSYYVSCNGGLYHLKTLLRATQEGKYASETSKIVRSLKCE